MSHATLTPSSGRPHLQRGDQLTGDTSFPQAMLPGIKGLGVDECDPQPSEGQAQTRWHRLFPAHREGQPRAFWRSRAIPRAARRWRLGDIGAAVHSRRRTQRRFTARKSDQGTSPEARWGLNIPQSRPERRCPLGRGSREFGDLLGTSLPLSGSCVMWLAGAW